MPWTGNFGVVAKPNSTTAEIHATTHNQQGYPAFCRRISARTASRLAQRGRPAIASAFLGRASGTAQASFYYNPELPQGFWRSNTSGARRLSNGESRSRIFPYPR